MKVVMPVAGKGSRFTELGITTPKPLVLIRGKHMAEWALASIPFVKPKDLIFILRKEHVENYKIDEKLKKIFGDEIKFITIDYTTEGAACTVLLAKEYINNDEQLIVTDSDHFFRNDNYFEKIQDEKVAGLIPVHPVPAEDTKWSFSKVDDNWKVSEVKEKIPISEYGNVGAYYFRRGRDFVSAVEEMIERDLRYNGEFYVAPVYNILIERGLSVYASLCQEVWCLGTPEDVQKFEEKFQE